MRTIRKLCAAMLALLLMAAPALAVSIGVVTNRDVDVHQLPAADSSAVAVSKGVAMTLIDCNDGWATVRLKGRTGYVPMQFLDLKNPVPAYLCEDASIYADAGAGELGALVKGTRVSILGVDGTYARVTDGHGIYFGYVALSALASSQSGTSLFASEDGAQTSKIERVIYTAQGLLGRPYTLKANPPESFHCAAFVHYCFDAAERGCVGETIGSQVHDARYAKIMTASALKRGDIVCFNISDIDDATGHVGIYVGEGWFIHASSADGKVTYSKLTSGYYQRSFSGGVRVFEG